jgi:RND family efflux transporter MFP subunit
MIFSKKTLTVALIVIIVGLGTYYMFFRNQGESSGIASPGVASEEERSGESPLPVKVATVHRGDLIIKLKSPGEAVTDLKVEMKAEVSGIIRKIFVTESQHVRKGDLLLELDDREYRLDLEKYEAERLQRLSELLLEKRFGESTLPAETADEQRIQAAHREYEKASESYQKGLISRDEYENASRQLELVLIEGGEKKDEIMAAAKGLTQAEVAVKKARLDLEKTKIMAPFSGIITDIKVSPQENVSSGTVLFTLVNIRRVKVHAKVLESEVGKMKVGREVDLRFSAYPERGIKARVEAISPIVNPEDKTCNVIIDFVNEGDVIKPGMHAEVEIAAEIYKDRLLVPQDAILTRGGRKLVFVVEEGLAKWKYIEIGLENEEYAEVLGSSQAGGELKEGMSVIIEGHFTIAHDARVRVVE